MLQEPLSTVQVKKPSQLATRYIPVLPLPMIPWLLFSAFMARRKYYLQVPVHDIMLVNVIHTLQYLMNTVAER